MTRLLSKVTLSFVFLVTATSMAWAKWLPVHQIGSDKPLLVADGQTGKLYKARLGNASSNWQVGTTQAFSHAVALADGGLYEFRLIHTQSGDDTTIAGLWDVYRDGSLVCDDCVGKAYGLDGAVGDTFKVYVGTPTTYAELWHFSGSITTRFDY